VETVSQTELAQVGLAVKRLQWRHHRGATARLAAIGLSLPQWDVLRHLGENPDASLHALAELAFQTDQSMGAMATRMIDRGLLERRPGPGRAIRHRITEAGEQARAAGAEIMRAVMEETIGNLPDDDIRTLHRLLLAAAAGPGRA
jgi:DNA-binding MarR family transcriptional regulator